MRVTITGGHGFIGSHLAETYRDQGHEVTCIDDHSASVVRHILGVENRQADAALTFRDLDGCDLVIHCASPVGAVGILPLAGRMAAEIQRTTYAVAQACARRDVPLVNISTSEVYGTSGVYQETDDLRVPAKRNARLEYAAGKLAAEFTVANTPGLRSVTVRPFNVAGPRQTIAKGFVLPTFVEQALQGRAMTVFGTGRQERSFTAVHDVCAFIQGLRAEHFDGRVVNVGNPENRTTVLGLASTVNQVLGTSAPVEFTTGEAVHGDGYAEAEGHVKVPDITLARGMGWEPAVDLEQLVYLTVADMPEWTVAA